MSKPNKFYIVVTAKPGAPDRKAVGKAVQTARCALLPTTTGCKSAQTDRKFTFGGILAALKLPLLAMNCILYIN